MNTYGVIHIHTHTHSYSGNRKNGKKKGTKGQNGKYRILRFCTARIKFRIYVGIFKT